MDLTICMATRDVLQSATTPLFVKPRLTDALLQRPPFRFLHDIVSAVQRKTGFAGGVFTEEESDARRVGESREKKVVYLEKLIAAVEVAAGQSLTVDPHKILAGVEPERTNLLLQTLGRVAIAEATVEPLNEDPSPTVHPFVRSRPPSRRGTQERPDVTLSQRGSAEDDNGPSTDTDDLPEHPIDGRQMWTSASPSSSVTSGDSGSSRRDSEVDISLPYERRPLSSEGVRIRELRREEADVGEEASQGIVLRRRRSVGSKSKAGLDVVDLIEALRRFGTWTSSLGRDMYHLFSAMDPMRKELAFWQREASLCADRLRATNSVSRDDPDENEMRDLDHEIEKRRNSIRELKHAVESNAETIMKMLQSITSDS